MDFTFGSTELATLHDLQTMAQKHGGHIAIDMMTYDFPEFDEKEIKEETELPFDKIYVYGAQYNINTISFNLIIGNEMHSLCLKEINLDFDYGFLDRLTQEDKEELENDGFEEKGHYCDSLLKTTVEGFETIPETVKSVNVYRYGIALREFSNLVCDFLGEPRIDRVY